MQYLSRACAVLAVYAGCLLTQACRDVLGIERGHPIVDAGTRSGTDGAIDSTDGPPIKAPTDSTAGGGAGAHVAGSGGRGLAGAGRAASGSGLAGTGAASGNGAHTPAAGGGGEPPIQITDLGAAGASGTDSGSGGAGLGESGVGGGGSGGDGGMGSGGSAGGEVDACLGVVCNTPPSALCSNENVRRSYASVGSCSAGQCNYAASDMSCGFGCANAACNADPCTGIACTTPIANYCQDPTHLVAHDTTGSCSNGSCSYGSQVVACTCESGACSADPCASVTCNTPPSALCAGPMTRRTYNAVGSCSGGSCSYAQTDTACPFGCSTGTCNPDPCSGISCSSPPTPACLSPTTLRSYAASGTCSAGACGYAQSDAACPSNQQCQSSACSVCKADSACGSGCTACGGGTPKCKDLGAGSQCVQCLSGTSCGGTTPMCNPTSNQCAECVANGDCKYGACKTGTCPFTLHGFSSPGDSSANRFVDKLYCGRVNIASAGNLAALGVRTVTAGVNLRLGLYSDSSGAPLTRQAQTAEIASLANGATEGTVSSVALNAGWHWVCLVASATVRITTESAVTQAFGTATYSYAALPATAPVLAAVMPDPGASDVYVVTTPP